MKFNKYILFIATIVSLTSCSSSIKTHSADYDVMRIKKTGIIQRPLVSDLEVAPTKQSFEATYNNVTETIAKENALGDFVQKYSCDLVVNPMFEVITETKNEIKKITVKLIGYPASFKNIRNFEQKDTASFMFLKHNQTLTINTAEPKPTTPIGATVANAAQVVSSLFKKKDGSSHSEGWGIEAAFAAPAEDMQTYNKSGYGIGIFNKLQTSKNFYFNIINLRFLLFDGGSLSNGWWSSGIEGAKMITATVGVGYKTKFNLFFEGNIGASNQYAGYIGQGTSLLYNAGLGYQFKKAHIKLLAERSGAITSFASLSLGLKF